ncbi:MAG TPA: tetratricopeptide repeat protein [Methylococcus sp.]|nr:tetratricopeptide repeat protein [Methylococcus sp.]
MNSLIFGLLGLVWAGTAWADAAAGILAVERGDYETAHREFRALAERGDSSAQVNLGNLYMKGLGGNPDYMAAAQWYRKAADQGDPLGQSKLGILYYYGLGVEKNPDEAARWFRKAAEQGEPGAQAILASMYAAGEGVIRDNVKAYYWYTLAADNGHAEALEARSSLVDEMAPGEINEALQNVGEWRREQLKRLQASFGKDPAGSPKSRSATRRRKSAHVEPGKNDEGESTGKASGRPR